MSRIKLDAIEDTFGPVAHQLGRMIDAMHSGRFVRFSRKEAWRPPVNVCETNDKFVICMELAGMPREAIDVSAEPGRVIIRGTRDTPRMHVPTSPKPTCMHVMEIDTGPFLREIKLSVPFDIDGIRAAYRDGYLWITVPKQLEPPPQEP